MFGNDYCDKYERTHKFWCKRPRGHEGCCENGVYLAEEIIRGTREECLHDLRAIAKTIATLSKHDCGRMSSAWRANMRRINEVAHHVGVLLNHVEQADTYVDSDGREV